MMRRATGNRARVSKIETFPAPSGGWMQSGNIVTASKQQAEVLDNFIPTAQGARLRGGAAAYADLGATVVRLFGYSSAGITDLFGSTSTGLYDVGRLNGGGSNAFADVDGLTSGDWSTTQISTSGGQFLVAVNGSDHAMYWDGADWNPIVAAAVNELDFDAESAAFTVGETLTGGTSGATAEILAITKSSATTGTLKLGAITGGPYQDDEAITDGATGAAVADGASAAASSIAITGVTTSDLSQVWLYKERLFFVERDTPSVWYLPVESIGGAASEINLGSVFKRGGSVVFGATWSLDSGSGLDDVCVFVSTEGEIAVYQGNDPASASTWALVGVYDIGEPVNKHGFFKAGGDLAVLTKDGIIPVSEALKKDRAALQAVALSYPIEDAWKDAIANETANLPITVSLWQSKTILLVGTPTKYNGKRVAFIANARTGAWGRVTGWDVRCSAVVADILYFGDGNGNVLVADSGGTDNGAQYTGLYVGKFSSSDATRSANQVSLTYRAPEELDFELDVMPDYQLVSLPTPGPTSVSATYTWGGGSTWGSGITWGAGGQSKTFTEWQTAYANGYALAPVVAITSAETTQVVFEILSTRVGFEMGYPR